MRTRRAWIVGVVAVAATALAQPAAAQEVTVPTPEPTTTTAPPSSTTTAQPSTTTTARRPGGGSSTTTSSVVPSPDDPGAADDAPADEVPSPDVTVPPPAPAMPGFGPPSPHQASRLVVRGGAANARASEAEQARILAGLHTADVRERLTKLERKLRSLRSEKKLAMARLERAREQLNDRAAWAYMRGPMNDLATVLETQDPNQMYTRVGMVRSVLDGDQDAVEEYRDARDALSSDLLEVSDDLADTKVDLVQAVEDEKAAVRTAEEASLELAIFSAGSDIVIHGFVFPVAEPRNFVDTFLAPRMFGTEYEHLHQGTDIFAPSGTDLLATERGVIARMGSDVLGGTKLWLVGESGAYYYYAHLSGYAPGMRPGLVVEAGDVVGFVGNTGNARGTPSHLHFEIHPRGGPAVNPYPLLKVVDDLEKAQRAEEAKKAEQADQAKQAEAAQPKVADPG